MHLISYTLILSAVFNLSIAALVPTGSDKIALTNGLTKRNPCVVTVWEGDGFSGQSWKTQGRLICSNLPDSLRGEMSSFEVLNCSCDFFEGDDCNGFRFNANERADGEMWKNGKSIPLSRS